MTIGIGIAGAGAGLAILRALQAVEAVSRGMVRGFVSLAVLAEDGEVLRAETQRGGSATLFDGDPPKRFADARIAVLMSSGPDRTEPLSQFTPARADVAFITGHRLPNMPGVDGRPLNAALLARIAQGTAVDAALAEVLEKNPQADAGLIAIAPDGTVAVGNTGLAARRTDGGFLHTQGAGLDIAILHNAIFPVRGLAEIAAGAAMDAVAPGDAHDVTLWLKAGLRLTLADEASVELGKDGVITGISVTNPGWLGAHWQGAAALRGTPLRRGGRTLGTLVTEAYCVAGDGVLLSCDGADSVRLFGASDAARGAGR
ncbi:MAG: DUF6963 family protein [Hyphomicrobiales bacterium]